jgi:hypothetical protein
MTDLEQRMRELLDEEARSAPPPPEAKGAISRTRRRQVATVLAGTLGVVALVAATTIGLRAVLSNDRGVPSDQPTTTTIINGISITHPAGWFVFDPDELGLNGPTDGPANARPVLPRLVLAVSPTDQGDLFGCPGLVDGPMPTFLMTVQEQPLTLAGEAATPWPVEPEPLAVEGGNADGIVSDAGCYPEWQFLHAAWTAEGRSFEGRIGFAPEVSVDERQAVLSAFRSMTFEPGTGDAVQAVLAEGTAGGEAWQLIASRDQEGLTLSIEGPSSGSGMGGFNPDAEQLQASSATFGRGDSAETVVFGAVPAGISRVEAIPSLATESRISATWTPSSTPSPSSRPSTRHMSSTPTTRPAPSSSPAPSATFRSPRRSPTRSSSGGARTRACGRSRGRRSSPGSSGSI